MRDQRRAKRFDEMPAAITRPALVPEPEPEGDGGFVAEIEVGGFDVAACKVNGTVDLVARNSYLLRLQRRLVAITKACIKTGEVICVWSDDGRLRTRANRAEIVCFVLKIYEQRNVRSNDGHCVGRRVFTHSASWCQIQVTRHRHQSLANLCFRPDFQSCRSRRPSSVAAKLMLLSCWDVTFGSIRQLNVKVVMKW